MECKEYFIKLKPINSFYFGSTKEFGSRNDNYFLKSNIYPQQTSLLGMLRKKILEDNGLLLPHEKRDVEHRKKEREFIGEVRANLKDSTFGMIKKLSPVQIYKGDMLYIFSYGDGQGEVEKDRFDVEKTLTNKGEKRLYIHRAKSFGGELRDIQQGVSEEILTPVVEVGINSFKRKKGEDDKAFFKKERYLFSSKDSYFGCYLKLDSRAKLENGFVQLGDRHSLFFMEVIQNPNQESGCLKNIFNIENAIFCLSDFYLTDEDFKRVLELSEGSLIQNNKFKHISRDEKNIKERVRALNLISRGSIFVFGESREAILDILKGDEYANFRKIGLNEYIEGGIADEG